MQTTISHGFQAKENRRRLIAMAMIAIVSLSLDWWLSANPSLRRTDYRAINAVTALVLYALLTPVARHDLGLRLLPAQGLRYWLRVGTILTAIMVVIGVGGMAILTSGHHWRDAEHVPTTPPEAIIDRFFVMCLEAPILEELLYRMIVCVPIAAVSPALAIAVSGILFAALHFAYGNPGPDNFLAGYLLAWTYLKSGTILVPIALHASGNAIALGFQVGAWYVLYG